MLRRGLLVLSLCVGCIGLVAQLQGQPPAAGGVEDVTYRAADGKVVEISTEIKESAAGVALIVGGKAKDVISPAAIIKVEPKTLPGIDAVAFGLARNLEKGPDLAKTLTEYGKLMKNIAAAPERSRRYVTFKEAMLTVKYADQKTGDEFKAEATKAVIKIAGFARANKKSWEVWPAARTAARIYTELGQYRDSATVLDDLSATPDLPKDLKAEAKLAQISSVIRSKQGLSADALLSELDKDASLSTNLKDRVNVLKVCAKMDYSQKPEGTATKPADQVKLIEDAIAAAKDPGARGMGYNFLGDLYAANNLNRDAMWSYLWSDTVYNTEKDEQLYALSKLAAIADRGNDADRATFFRERMVRARQ
jgi:hypothetical protein